jgi:sterol desaturase/sphingolipid hydroxylase (fatty acid hydroxylase superfamily)
MEIAAMVMTVCLAFGAGALAWSFTEYALHGWLGHKGRERNTFSKEHMAHHRNVTYFTPTGAKARVASVILVPIGIALTLAAGLPGLAGTLGATVGYLAYEIIHRRTHTHPPRGPYSRWARKHHLSHHFNCPNANYGVTSPLWDMVFRTHEAVAKVRVPRRKAMIWLLDPASGQMHGKYAADYELKGRQAAA